jgi:dethiobiotin synthetase
MPLQQRIYLVLGIGTDVGKTFFVEKICKNLRKNKLSTAAIKPIASGFQLDDPNSDSAKILAALGLEISKENIKKITPWRFAQASSPHFAAQKNGEEINFDELKNFCLSAISAAEKSGDFLFIEAAGGVMTPISYQKTFLDLAAALQLPTLLVAANYLGSISHTLCCVEALKSRGILLEKIILNELPNQGQKALASISDFKNTLESFVGGEVVILDELLA